MRPDIFVQRLAFRFFQALRSGMLDSLWGWVVGVFSRHGTVTATCTIILILALHRGCGVLGRCLLLCGGSMIHFIGIMACRDVLGGLGSQVACTGHRHNRNDCLKPCS